MYVPALFSAAERSLLYGVVLIRLFAFSDLEFLSAFHNARFAGVIPLEREATGAMAVQIQKNKR
jgi:hypothetical protein